jgi:hypothetical protein
MRPISKAIEFISKLKDKGIYVEYIPKEKAIKLLSENWPRLIEAFKKY